MRILELKNATVTYPIRRRTNASSADLENQELGGQIVSDKTNDYVRALDRVNFRLYPGNRVGLLGFNGSGKSTLLKALAGIVPLSTGERRANGRIVTLFSTSCGIDPERSGEDNVRRLAALHNLSSKEVPDLIKAIGEFTELGAYMKLPVKSYSNGMRARMGFAFATSIPADIVLIDEIIGAGDSSFYAQARARLTQFVEKSGTVVIASHSTAVLTSLCTRGFLLRRGRVAFQGRLSEALEHYSALRMKKRGSQALEDVDDPTREAD